MTNSNGLFHRMISSSRPSALDGIVAALYVPASVAAYRLIEDLVKPPHSEFTIPAIVALTATFGLSTIGYVGARLMSIYFEREDIRNLEANNGPTDFYNPQY